MRLSFRVEVDSLRGALEGVPALLKLFDEHHVEATFLLSLGPDYSSNPLKYLLPWSLLSKLPASRIGNRAADNLKKIPEVGHEVGVAPFFAEAWRRGAAFFDKDDTRRIFDSASAAFQRLFGEKPRLFGASGWQINPYVLQLEEAFGFKYATDTRGKTVFLPQLQGVNSGCVQIPTTLPTVDEMLARDKLAVDKVHEYLFAESQRVLPSGEVFSINAEREGIDLFDVLEKLIVMWKGSQWEFRTLGALYASLGDAEIPRHQIGWSEPEGRAGHVAMQSLLVDKG